MKLPYLIGYKQFRSSLLVIMSWVFISSSASALTFTDFFSVGPVGGGGQFSNNLNINLSNSTMSLSLPADAGGGVIVGSGAFSPNFYTEAIRYTISDRTVSRLGYLPGDQYYSEATAVSADGRVIIGQSEDEGFRYTATEGMVSLRAGNIPSALSADGSVITGNDFEGKGFRYTSQEGMTSLDFFTPSAISADGNVIAGNSYSGAARHTDSEGIVDLGFIQHLNSPDFAQIDFDVINLYSSVSDISEDGHVIVGNSSTNAFKDTPFTSFSVNISEAFRYTDSEGMVGLGFLPTIDGSFSYSNATSVSADGRIIVGDSNGEIFIWDSESNVMKSFEQELIASGMNPMDWELYNAFILKDGSAILGTGIHNNNAELEIFVAPISSVPLPASFWLMGSALLGLIRISRKKGR